MESITIVSLFTGAVVATNSIDTDSMITAVVGMCVALIAICMEMQNLHIIHIHAMVITYSSSTRHHQMQSALM